MKCPHCQKAFHAEPHSVDIGRIGRTDNWVYFWKFLGTECPACHKPIAVVEYKEDYGHTKYPGRSFVVYPKGSGRNAPPADVPAHIAQEYEEACLVLNDSPQASAALSRRCLQHILQERSVSKSSNLNTAIEDALATNLPSHISENLDSIRNTGNFAAHPQKSINTGEILPVEPHEAEWNLEVLEMLFDFYYVQPARSAARRAALNAKLADAGKPSMKSPPEKGGAA
jgi:hypothetical protein